MNNIESAQRHEPRKAPKIAMLSLVGSLLIPAACGNDPTGGEPTTLPPTTIDISTTLPPTTTTEPVTSTIPTTSTTVAETTTTIKPIDLSIPTGEMTQIVEMSPGEYDYKEIAPGEIYYVEKDGSGDAEYTYISVAVLDMYNRPYEDVNGVMRNIDFIDVFFKYDTHGDPLTITIGLNEENNYISEIIYVGRDVDNYVKRGWETLEILRPEIERRKENKSQIGIAIISSYNQQFFNRTESFCNDESQYLSDLIGPSYCTLMGESFRFFDDGKLLIDILNKEELSPEDRVLLESKVIWANELSLFPVSLRD